MTSESQQFMRDLRVRAAQVNADFAAGQDRRMGMLIARTLRGALEPQRVIRPATGDDRERGHFIHKPQGDDEVQDAASVPYQSPTDPRHVPMTGTHSHDHAAYGYHDGDDGMHLHVHTHANDADHHHTHVASGVEGTGISGSYGREMTAANPAQRAALRNARQADHEARR
jgi:hypothetical protein